MTPAERVATKFTGAPDPILIRVAAKYTVARTLLAFGVKDLEQLSKRGRQFGVLSAYRSNLSKSENQKRHGELVADLQKLGLKFEPLKSQWEDMETKKVKHEKSLFIPHIKFETLQRLSKKYDQDAALYKDPSGTVGIYYKNGEADMAVPEEPLSKSTDPKKDFSRGRGLSFGMKFLEGKKFKYTDRALTHEDVAKQMPSEAKSESAAPEEKKPEGVESEWWKSQTPEQKKDYCEAHPGSGYCGP